MTETSKQRMEELASPYTSGQKLVFKAGYQAGMQDPDAGKMSVDDYLGLYERIGRALKDTGVPLTTHEMAEMRNVIRSHAKANDENKKLREALTKASDLLVGSMSCLSNEHFSNLQSEIETFLKTEAKKALSSGGVES